MLGAIVGTLLKKAAEGGYGPGAKALYEKLIGKKTAIGIVCGAVLGVVYFYNLGGNCGWCQTTTEVVLAVSSAFGVFLGQVDGALRLEPPKK